MTRTIGDWLIKCMALAVAAAAVIAYWEQRDNGKYVYHEQPATESYEGSSMIIDTRTGTLFTVEGRSFVELHPQTGSVTLRPGKSAN